MKIALVGFGNVARALVRLLDRQRPAYPFTVTGIHTARHGTAYGAAGLPVEPVFGPPRRLCAGVSRPRGS